MADYYVDADAGNDGNSGVDWANAKLHVSAVISLLTYPLTSSVTIHLRESTTLDYEETANDDNLSLIGIVCVGDAELIIQSENWNSSNYTDESSPIGGASFDPTEDKLVVCEFLVDIRRSNSIRFNGIEFCAPSSAIAMVGMGIGAQDHCSNIQVHYCTIAGWFAGVVVAAESWVSVYNSQIMKGNYGVVAEYNGKVLLSGDNYIQEMMLAGVVAYTNSSIMFYPWDSYHFTVFTTRITTTGPRQNYSAIFAAVNSTLYVRTDEFNQITPMYARVLILDQMAERTVHARQYFGVKLEARSLLTGARNVQFGVSTVNNGMDTIPAGQQIVLGGDGTSISLK